MGKKKGRSKRSKNIYPPDLKAANLVSLDDVTPPVLNVTNSVGLNDINIAALKIALDDSSDKNRNFLIAFLLVELYTLIAVLGTTDLNLFLADSLFEFPFINLKLPLTAFYFLAPLIVLAFHYNLLFNLLEHNKILYRWLNHKENIRQVNSDLLHAFMFNTRAKYDKYEGKVRSLNYHLLNVIIGFMVSFFPLCLMAYILWKFAAFQHLWITTVHLVIVLVSIWLHVFYWLRIQTPELLHKNHENFLQLLPELSSKFILKWVLRITFFVSVSRVFLLYASYFFPEIFTSYLDNPIVKRIIPRLIIKDVSIKPLSNKGQRSPTVLKDIKSLDTLPILVGIEDANPGAVRITSVEDCLDNQDYIETNLSNRSFLFSIIEDSVFCNLKLVKSDLRGARIKRSKFSGKFDLAKFSGVNLTYSQFQEKSSLVNTEFIDAKISHVVANNTNFTLANFNGADILATELNSAEFVQAKLQGTTFTMSQVNAVNFRSANLQKSRFIQTDLIGVDLRFTVNDYLLDFLNKSKIQSCYIDSYSLIFNGSMYKGANCLIYNPLLATDKRDEASSKGEVTRLLRERHNSKALIHSMIAVTVLAQTDSIDLKSHLRANLPTELLTLNQLKGIVLSHNELDAAQFKLITSYLINIETMDFSANKLTKIPDTINDVPNLLELNVSQNQLKELFSSLNDSILLERLDVSGNMLVTLSPEIGKLSQLKSLDLSDNQLATLPPEIGKLDNLVNLNVSGNKLSSFAPYVGGLSALTNLDLSNNKLAGVPLNVFSLIALKELYINHNELSSRLPAISQLKLLNGLDVSNNNLLALPEDMGALEEVVWVHANNNKISVLPKDVGNLINLESLELENNKLIKLPREWIELPNLKLLKVKGNKLVSPPQEVADEGLEAIKIWFKDHDEL